jgi:putative ABC transport system permease protein
MNWLTTLTEGIMIALESLRANKVRSGLTVLGVTIGVTVVMVMAAAITGINDSFTELISSRGPTTFYVAHAPQGGGIQTGTEEEESAFMKNPPLQPRWAHELAQLPAIKSADAIADLSQSGYRARHRAQNIGVALVAVGADFLETDNGTLEDGRFFTSTEAKRGRPVAVVDSQVAEDLYEGRDPLQRRFTLSSASGRSTATPFQVIGTYRRADNLFAGFVSHYMLVPFEAAWQYVPFWHRLVTFIVTPKDGVPLDVAMDQVEGKMRQIRRLHPGQKDNFAIITQDEILKLWGQLTTALFSVMFALSSVGLMVGGVGVIGIMMISVTERTREIGVRKALGARRRDILWQFLVEASTVTLVGGATGMAIGGAIVWAIDHWTPIPATVPLWSVVAALGVSALTGIGFGLYPASRGAKLNPVEALRYE